MNNHTGSFMETDYLSAEVVSDDEIQRQTDLIHRSGAFRFSNLVPYGLLVLNKCRQAVFANKGAVSMAHVDDESQIIGKRPGTIFQCIHSDARKNGCGTSVFCRECGAAKAIRSSYEGLESHGDCRMLCHRQQKLVAIDLRVTAAPFEMEDDEVYTVFTLQDISSEKRRRALERIFFHDVLNHAGALRGISQYLVKQPDAFDDTLANSMAITLERMVEEILAQRDLVAAECGELTLRSETIQSVSQLETVANFYRKYAEAEKKIVLVDKSAADAFLITDHVLLGRVLGNMVKNALEASVAGDTVFLSCRRESGRVVFSVHNPAVMSRKVQLQVFKRSFSTKGSDRGLGTYSIMLLGERYLNGQVGFTSAEGLGTEFWISLPV